MKVAKLLTTVVVMAIALTGIAEARGGGGRGGSRGGHSGGRSYSSGKSGGHVSVKGYVKKNGKYVSGYKRTSADKTKVNNFSTRGNVNPYTGKEGTKEP